MKLVFLILLSVILIFLLLFIYCSLVIAKESDKFIDKYL